jgi:hypothetical protein
MSEDQVLEIYETVRPSLQALAALNADKPWASTR